MKKGKEKIGIIGYGEIGKAVAKFYKKPLIKDLKRDDDLRGVYVLHVCIPWSKNFKKIIENNIKEINPSLVIIHSTVAPETTKSIKSKISKSCAIVHSPVRGVHPNLHKGIKTFIKYIGADNKKDGEMARNHFKKIGIKTKIFNSSVTTEIGKLLDTTYYGVCIAWHGEMKKICDKYKINFENAVTDFNKSYNEGYKNLGKINVVRPILYPPKDKIGGHCVVSNAKILNKYFKTKAIDLILEYKLNNN